MARSSLSLPADRRLRLPESKVAKRLSQVARQVRSMLRDLGPLVAVVAVFQGLVLGQPLPELERTLAGLACVALGLALFVRGLDMALFPLGEAMADAFARKGSLAALLSFAFLLGFTTTVAEPALIAIAEEGARASAEAKRIAADEAAVAAHALELRLVVAASVGTALVVGVLRILRGWPVHWLILGGYAAALAMTPFAPREIVGIAYDSGGVTTSTVTVPLVTALGVGLASAIRGRSPLLDGFGLIALASLMPMLFLLALGIAGDLLAGRSH
jgi:hypothetical protein